VAKIKGGGAPAPSASAPAPKAAPSAPARAAAPAPAARSGGGGNSTNQAIQKQLASAGSGVNYKEAASVAQKLGVSVDRVFNQTARTGQTARAGAAAANAGYVPSSQLKVNSPITARYAQQVAANAQARLDAAAAAGTSINPDGTQDGYLPEFDWEAWNAEMMAQQAAIWESMDAMNAEFMQRQQDWLAQMDRTPQTQFRSGSAFNNLIPADKAQVKRQKRARQSSTTRTGLNTAPSTGNLSLGGASSNAGGLSIGKG
jgi:hypothetical protein